MKRFGLQDVGTPCLVVDLAIVRSQIRLLREALPECRLFYAMKCNPEPDVIRAVLGEGCGIEIASLGELQHLQQHGLVTPDHLISSNPVKPRQDIASQAEAGVKCFAADSRAEIEKIAAVAPTSSVFVRFNVSNSGSLVDLSRKFGCDPHDVLPLMRLAKAVGLQADGLAFHVGSQAEEPAAWASALKTAGNAIQELDKEGISVQILNVGGGFPAQYHRAVPGISEIADVVRESVRKYVPREIELWAEPGRFITAAAGTLVSTIIGRATRGDTEWLYLDVGRFQAFGELFESEEFRYPVSSSRDLEEVDSVDRRPFTLTGPTCDSYDTIMGEVFLPAGLAEGDRIHFAQAGAYTHVYGSSFNGCPVPQVICVG